jgi:hypothetical protein
MSGCTRSSQRATWVSRWRMELTFQEAMRTWGGYSTEKLVPQPQAEAAFGLRTVKWAPISASE